MTGMMLAGRPSGSAMTKAQALAAPLQPYRPSRWGFHKPGTRKHSLPLWEIPVGVTPGVRMPVIGTNVGMLSPFGARTLYKCFKIGQTTLQFEMHGIDLLDKDDEAVIPALAAKQPDVRRPWPKKRAAYQAFLGAHGGRLRLRAPDRDRP